MGDPSVLIAWDVDDVLNTLTRDWLEEFNREAGIDVDYGSLRENPHHAALGISRATYLASLDTFRRDRYASLGPSRLALEWLAAHGAAARHVAVTATPRRSAQTVTDWVLRHFGRWIEEVHVVPSPRPDDPTPLPPPDKGALLATLGERVVLVDDSPAQVASARARQVRALLYPQPWNDERRSDAEVLRDLAELVEGSLWT